MNNSQTPHTLQFRWIGIFLLCMFLAASVGYAFFEYIETSEKIDTNKTLASVGQLKSGQIQAYLAERKSDAAIISSFLSAPSEQHWLERQGINAPDALGQLAESVITAFQYRELLLLDASANIRLDVGHGGMLSEAGKTIAMRAMRERTPVSFQIYFGDPSAPDVPVLDTFVSVMNADGSRAVGMVVLRNELNILFSLLQTWPVESKTAESLLVTKDGSDVLFLNELRHKKGTALKLRVPLSSDTNSPAWPAISAVTGHLGLFEANDYRGEHILAYTIAVPDTPWGMVVKMDVAEATERSRTLQKVTAMVIIAMIALLGIIAWIGWRKAKADRLAKKLLEESQHRLLQSEKMLNEAQQLVHLGGLERNFVTGSLTCSEEIFRILEIDPAHTDISYEEFILTVHPEDREAVDQAYLTCIRTREPFDIVHRLLLAGGRVKWVNEHGNFYYDASGVPLRSIGTIQDITERKQAEKTILESENRYHRLHESMRDAFVMVDMSGRLIDFNCAYQEMLGYSIEELQRLTYVDLTPQKWHEFEARIIEEQVIPHDQSTVYEKEYIRKDGTVFPVELKTFLLRDKDNQPEAMWAVVRDITERKQAQLDLQHKQGLLNEAQRLGHLGSWELDLTSGALLWSDEVYRIFELDPAQFTPSYEFFLGVIHSDDRCKLSQAYMQSLENHQPYDIAHRLRLADGRIKWVRERCTSEFNALGKPLRSVGVVQDITEQKLAEETLRIAATTFETHEGITITDAHGKIIRVNQAFENITGYSQEEVLGKNPRILNSGCQDKAFYAAMWQQLLNNGSWTGELCNRRKDGQIYPERLTITAVKNERGATTEYVAIFSDITERKQAEEKLHKYNDELAAINRQLSDTQNLLLQSDKMASVGQLAAGVAHEINNPIGYVSSNLGTLDEYLKELLDLVAAYEEMKNVVADSDVLALVKTAKDKVDLGFLKEDIPALMMETQEGITRVKKIVQDLKDFSRADSGDEWHRADLHKGLDSTLNVASNEIKYKADVKKDYGDIAEVECVISQLNQVFMNLLVNAAHAIENYGIITVRTGQQGGEVWVEVVDTGKGIAPEHIKKIFDPFFTTKPIGKGTGLGLSLSYGIIQKHHGRIEVSSEVGKGTSFKVWLPVSQPQDDDTAVGRVSAA